MKNPGFAGSTAVTLTATAVASVGIVVAEPSVKRAAAPAIGTVIVAPGWMRTFGPPIALRVSTTRNGVVPTNAGLVEPPANQPAMSTRKWVVALEKKHTRPLGPTGATTPLATTPPATKFRFDASGRATSQGQTVA